MLVGLRKFDSWNQLNDELERRFGARGLVPGLPRPTVQAYLGLGHALFDVLQGLKAFFPHKRTLVVMRGGDPYIEGILPEFYREGFQIQYFSSLELQNLESWFATLNKDVLAVIASRDHAFTGELFLPSDIGNYLSQKRLPLIEINHIEHFHNSNQPSSFQIFLRQYSEQVCVGVLGSRIKVFAQSAHLLDWNSEAFVKCLDRDRPQTNESLILEFEAKLESPFVPLFGDQFKNRIFDRSVIDVNPLGGDFFIKELSNELLSQGLSLLQIQHNLESTHLCRWGGINTYKWWGDSPLDEKKSVSLVAIGVPLIESPLFLEAFLRAKQKAVAGTHFL